MEWYVVVLIWIAIFVLPYLLGSINTGIIVSRVGFNDDVRLHGSGNAGMTNVLRTYGVGPAAITFAGDFIKSVAATMLARELFNLLAQNGHTFLGILEFDGAYIGGLCALLGHIFPIFFNFRGGKGVMTGFGIFFVLQPIAALIVFALFIVIVWITRYISLGSMTGAVVYPILIGIINSIMNRPVWSEVIIISLYSLIIIVMHRENISRLINGKENKFSFHPKTAKSSGSSKEGTPDGK